MLIITIDTGTSNTRVKLWQDNRLISQAFVEVGVRDTAITGSRDKLQMGVRRAILDAVKAAGTRIGEIGLFLASGMITSNVGLCEVTHVSAPAGLKELALGMVSHNIDAVVGHPIWFVPGIKNHARAVDLANYEAMDIMRGEEVETFGLIEKLKLQGPAVFVLPGSHSKFITLDVHNRVTACLTTLAGELLDIITGHTILAGAVNKSFAQEFDEAMLLEGARCSTRVGLGRTCFSVRILELFGATTPNQRANFLLGAVLAQDLTALKNSSALQWNPDTGLVLTGRKIMKQAFKSLIGHDSFFQGKVLEIDDDLTADLAAIGAIAVARERGLIAKESAADQRG
jgi:2-dehydro-3-deoxygalactonokinase